jgi:hypothetical protein
LDNLHRRARAQLGELLREVKKAAGQTKKGETQPAAPAAAPEASSSPAATATTASANSTTTTSTQDAGTGSVVHEQMGRYTSYIDSEAVVLVTRKRPTSLADAKANVITSVKDGEPVFLYVRTPKPLKEYVRYDLDARKDNQFAEFRLVYSAPIAQNGEGPWDRSRSFNWPLTFAELEKNEFTIAFSPPMMKRRANTRDGFCCFTESYVFMREFASDGARRGIYATAFYVIDDAKTKGSSTPMHLVGSAPLTVDIGEGMAKYRAIKQNFFKCTSASDPAERSRDCKGFTIAQ